MLALTDFQCNDKGKSLFGEVTIVFVIAKTSLQIFIGAASSIQNFWILFWRKFDTR